MDPRRKPVEGEPFRPSARQTGLFIDTANRVDMLQRVQEVERQRVSQSTLILVKNNTGGDLGRLSIVGIGAPVFNPAVAAQANQSKQTPTFMGVTPTAAHAGKFAILSQPLAAGAIGTAVIAGGAWVSVDVSNDDHEFAQAVAGETGYLESTQSSGAQILWREGGTGEQWAYVRIGDEGSGASGGAGGPSFPPGVTCNCENCVRGVTGLSDFCCEAPYQWTVNLGDLGEHTLTWDSENVWKSGKVTNCCEVIDEVLCDDYQVTLTISKAAQTAVLTIIETSEDDYCADVCFIYRNVNPWKCLCDNHMTLDSSSNAHGLPCDVCVKPKTSFGVVSTACLDSAKTNYGVTDWPAMLRVSLVFHVDAATLGSENVLLWNSANSRWETIPIPMRGCATLPPPIYIDCSAGILRAGVDNTIFTSDFDDDGAELLPAPTPPLSVTSVTLVSAAVSIEYSPPGCASTFISGLYDVRLDLSQIGIGGEVGETPTGTGDCTCGEPDLPPGGEDDECNGTCRYLKGASTWTLEESNCEAVTDCDCITPDNGDGDEGDVRLVPCGPEGAVDAPNDCWCAVDGTEPSDWDMDLSGESISGSGTDYDCAGWNGSGNLTFQAVGSQYSCTWLASSIPLGGGRFGDVLLTVSNLGQRLDFLHNDGGGEYIVASYISAGYSSGPAGGGEWLWNTLDCENDLTLYYTSSVECANWPATITLTPTP